MNEDERNAVLERMDRLAVTLIERAAPVSYRLASSEAEKDAIYRLRARVVLAHGWARPEDLPGGIERDRFDDRATHIAGWHEDRIVATARLVFPIPGDTLPTAEHFAITQPLPATCANLDRMAVDQDHADPGHRIFNGLAFQGWLELRARGFATFVGVVTPGMLRLYRRVGFNVEPIGEPRIYWGEERLPCLFDPLDGFTRPGASEHISIDEWAAGQSHPHSG